MINTATSTKQKIETIDKFQSQKTDKCKTVFVETDWDNITQITWMLDQTIVWNNTNNTQIKVHW